MSVSTKKSNFILYIVIVVLGIIFAAPFIWMVSTSLKSPAQLYVPEFILIPNPVMWENFSVALSKIPFLRYSLNTIFLTITSIIFQLLSCGLVAYGFARLNFKFKKFLFSLLLASMMLPSTVRMIPEYLIWMKIGGIDTYFPLLLPKLFGSAYFVFLLRQFYLTIPKELDEAAKIDGCSYFGIWWRILLPITKPAMTTVAVFTFMGVWNDFFGPLIYLTDDSLKTLALALRSFQGQFGSENHLMMAASLVVLLPCLLIFVFSQRYFVKGIALSGIKG